MSKKEHPTAKQLRAAAQVMRKYADTLDLMAETMESKQISTVFVDNWATAMRGLGYLRNAAVSVSYEYLHHGTSQVVRDLLEEYKSTERAADEIQDTRPAKKPPKRKG